MKNEPEQGRNTPPNEEELGEPPGASVIGLMAPKITDRECEEHLELALEEEELLLGLGEEKRGMCLTCVSRPCVCLLRKLEEKLEKLDSMRKPAELTIKTARKNGDFPPKTSTKHEEFSPLKLPQTLPFSLTKTSLTLPFSPTKSPLTLPLTPEKFKKIPPSTPPIPVPEPRGKPDDSSQSYESIAQGLPPVQVCPSVDNLHEGCLGEVTHRGGAVTSPIPPLSPIHPICSRDNTEGITVHKPERQSYCQNSNDNIEGITEQKPESQSYCQNSRDNIEGIKVQKPERQSYSQNRKSNLSTNNKITNYFKIEDNMTEKITNQITNNEPITKNENQEQ